MGAHTVKSTVCPKCNGTGQVEDQIKLGAKFRHLRVRRNLSGREMARQMDISAAYLCDLELGRRHWNAWLIKSFMAKLGE